MLAEYLDNASMDMQKMKETARKLYAQYDQTLDRDVRNELVILQKKAAIKKRAIWATIYENLEEFRFMKKHFPQLFQVYAEDEYIGKIISAKEWLADFREMRHLDAEDRLIDLRTKINLLKALKGQLNSIAEPYDDKKLGDAWSLIGEKITEKTDKHEITDIIDIATKKFRQDGWAIRLNEPFVIKHINDFLGRLKDAIGEEVEAKRRFEDSKGRGTFWEYKAKQELDLAIKNRKRIERLTRHILVANPKFLAKFKSQH
ncbi:MAG: hypothetical protein WCT31_03215, partial [Candidatus Micrarchaeia archaeon]